ncbi:MAG: hypothetical protein IPN22_05385 [Bacteroidetes bacterium]|nr:hypothetical protein [Bacteroidota bacterium]
MHATHDCKKQFLLRIEVTVKMDISPYISSLLLEHDCVIVPGLGGFVQLSSIRYSSRSPHYFSTI